MRKIFSAVFFLILAASCEPETIVRQNANISDGALYRGATSAANPNNPYDSIGQLHNDVLEAYLPFEKEGATISEIVTLLDSLARTDSRFTAFVTNNYIVPTASGLQGMLNNPAGYASDKIDSAGLGTAAKTSLAGLMDDVILLYTKGKDYDEAYDYLTDYEAQVLAGSFTAAEKKTLLTTAAVSRHSYWFSVQHKKRKPRDRDWDLLITTLAASIEDPAEDTATAVMRSVAAAAVANQ